MRNLQVLAVLERSFQPKDGVMSVAVISVAGDVSYCRQLDSWTWADGSQTLAGGS
jgi:hypothetical protein